MIIYAKIKLDQIDKEGPKGEELDQEIEEQITSAIEGIDIEGREVSRVTIDRQPPDKDGKDSPRFLIGQALTKLQPIEMDNGIHKIQLEDPYGGNEKYTWREMLVYWGQELQKAETNKDRK